jgi:hypothetical protein
MSDTVDEQWWQTEENDEVATKPKLWRPLSRAVGGFDLDPAAGCEPTPIADGTFTRNEDGLMKSWYGTVWLNPPFSDKTPWYRKLVSEYWNGDVDRAVALATVDPSAEWFHSWFSTADIICYHTERDLYLARGDSPTFSTQIGVWNRSEEIENVLKGMGTIVEPRKDNNQTKL